METPTFVIENITPVETELSTPSLEMNILSGATTWGNVVNKPFETLGTGLEVVSGALNVTVDCDVTDVKQNGVSVVDANKVALVTVPTKTSDITNDSGFVDNTYHDNTKYDASNPSGFVTASYHDSTKYDASNPSGYITSAALTGKEDTSNKTIVLNNQSTNTLYPGAKVVYDNILDVREIAAGKNANLVANITANPSLNSQASTISVSSITDIDGVVHAASTLKKGDNIYVTDIDVPDRWVGTEGSTVTLYKLETAKVPVTDVKVNGTTVVSNTVANVIVPTKTSDITNDSGFITSAAISGKENTSNKVTSISSSSTNTQYPSAKCVYNIVGNIEATLIAIRGV